MHIANIKTTDAYTYIHSVTKPVKYFTVQNYGGRKL